MARRRGWPLATGARRWRGPLLLAIVALLAVACGSTTTEEDAESGDGGGSAPSAEGDGPGVTSDTVKVGFVITDLEQTARALDFEIPDQGDMEGQIEALVAHINENGGIGGRQIEPVVEVFNALQDTPSKEEELCLGFTQDAEVFGVLLTGQFQENARPCYAEAETLVLDATLFPLDQATFDDLTPFVWQPSLPTYDEVLEGLADTLADGGFLGDDAKLGVVGIDNEQNRRVFENALEPRLSDLGIEIDDTQWIDPSDSTTLQTTQDQAVLSFKDNGVDRVIVMGGSRLAAFLIQTAQAQNYEPVFAMTSFDNPEFNIQNYPSAMTDSVGITLAPGWDVSDDQYPLPATDVEEECLGILSDAGFEFDARTNARTALGFCDGLLLLQAGAEDLTDELNAVLWSEAVGALGDSLQLSSAYATEFNPDDHAGASGYRVFAYDPSCDCMAIEGETVSF